MKGGGIRRTPPARGTGCQWACVHMYKREEGEGVEDGGSGLDGSSCGCVAGGDMWPKPK